jgi:hypothetical protein
MSAENKRATYKFSDDIIVVIRDLLQLALLTNTNIIDHLRAVVVEPETDEDRAHYITLTPEYVEAYNAQIEDLNRRAEEAMKEEAARLAAEPSDKPTDLH